MSMITPAPDVTLHTLDNPQQAEEVVVKAAPEGPGLPARPLETEARRQKEQLVDEDVDFANIFGAAPAADQPFDAVPLVPPPPLARVTTAEVAEVAAAAVTAADAAADAAVDAAVCAQPQRLIGAYTPEQRRARIARYLEKRKRRVYQPRIVYSVRKRQANDRPRNNGRFMSAKKPKTDAAAAAVADGGGGVDGAGGGAAAAAAARGGKGRAAPGARAGSAAASRGRSHARSRPRLKVAAPPKLAPPRQPTFAPGCEPTRRSRRQRDSTYFHAAVHSPVGSALLAARAAAQQARPRLPTAPLPPSAPALGRAHSDDSQASVGSADSSSTASTARLGTSRCSSAASTPRAGVTDADAHTDAAAHRAGALRALPHAGERGDAQELVLRLNCSLRPSLRPGPPGSPGGRGQEPASPGSPGSPTASSDTASNTDYAKDSLSDGTMSPGHSSGQTSGATSPQRDSDAEPGTGVVPEEEQPLRGGGGGGLGGLGGLESSEDEEFEAAVNAAATLQGGSGGITMGFDVDDFGMEGMEGMDSMGMDLDLGMDVSEGMMTADTADAEGDEGQPLYRGLGGLAGAKLQREAEMAAAAEAEAAAETCTDRALAMQPRACAATPAAPMPKAPTQATALASLLKRLCVC